MREESKNLCLGGVGTEGRRGNGGTATAGSICHAQVMYLGGSCELNGNW